MEERDSSAVRACLRAPSLVCGRQDAGRELCAARVDCDRASDLQTSGSLESCDAIYSPQSHRAVFARARIYSAAAWGIPRSNATDKLCLYEFARV